MEVCDHAGSVALEDAPGRGEQRFGGEHPLGARVLQDVIAGLRAGRGFADVERLRHVVGLLGASLYPRGFHTRPHCGVIVGIFAIDLCLARRACHRVGDHGTHVAQRRFPIVPDRHDVDGGDIGGAGHVVQVDARLQEAAPCPRALLQPSADQPRRQRIHQPLLVEDNRVVVEVPRAQHAHRDQHRHARFDQGRRYGLAGIGLAEIGLGRGRADALPAGEMLRHQPHRDLWVHVAGHDHRGALGPIPAIVEGTDRVGGPGGQRFHRADR